MKIVTQAWTKEKCQAIALRHKFLIDFRNKDHRCYLASVRCGWLTDVTKHMSRDRKWDQKRVVQEIKKYATLKEFKDKCGGAYKWVLKNKLQEVLFSNLGKRPNNYWTQDRITKEVEKCKSLSEVKSKTGLFSAVKRNGMSYLFEKFYTDIKCEYREKELQNRVYKYLKIKYPDLCIEREKAIPVIDNNVGFVDIFIRNPVNKQFIVIELKHSESRWTKKEIASQMDKYQKAYGDSVGFKGVYLFSDTGKYGLKIDSLGQIIKRIRR